MNVLFLTLSGMEDLSERTIYTDLVRNLADRNVNIYVVSPREKRRNLPTELIKNGNITTIMVKTGNVTKTNFIEKGFSTLRIESQYLKAIKTFCPDIRFDIVLYSTPPITYARILRYFKKRGSRTYLMLKDIFPQNAVDMGLIKKSSLIYRYFRRMEKKVYALSDYIGCMSVANVNYVLKNNPELNPNKVEIFPNTIEILPPRPKTGQAEMRIKFGLPVEKTVFVLGGNLGVPQGIDFLIDCLGDLNVYDKAFFVIVGDGTERERIETVIKKRDLNNVCLLGHLPKDYYDRLILECDVGLVLLDKRFTIPNYPSRILSYMDMALPVLAATDQMSDINQLLSDARCGLWSYSGDKKKFIQQVKQLSENQEMRAQMGENGRRYLESHFAVEVSAQILADHFGW